MRAPVRLPISIQNEGARLYVCMRVFICIIMLSVPEDLQSVFPQVDVKPKN